MDPLGFVKYEGAGNDFLVVEGATAEVVTPERAVALCDRHFGVGADGVLLVLPASRPGARARMVVLNADGSRPEMCGNGLRCVALHLAVSDGATRAEYELETDAGARSALVERRGLAAEITQGMGRGQLGGHVRFPARGEDREFLLVDMGNPHAVAFGPALRESELDEVGPALSATQPAGANVEIATPVGERLDVLVWERGVGRTLACGTGAAAVGVAAASTGRARFGAPVEVRLPGGSLFVTVAEGSLEVTMRGPARRVFVGRVGA